MFSPFLEILLITTDDMGCFFKRYKVFGKIFGAQKSKLVTEQLRFFSMIYPSVHHCYHRLIFSQNYQLKSSFYLAASFFKSSAFAPICPIVKTNVVGLSSQISAKPIFDDFNRWSEKIKILKIKNENYGIKKVFLLCRLKVASLSLLLSSSSLLSSLYLPTSRQRQLPKKN